MMRTQQRVNEEYDETKWRRALKAAQQGCELNEVMRQSFDGTPERLQAFCSYADHVLALVTPELFAHDCIIELGYGFGYWLNRFRSMGYTGRLCGFDISPTALDAARLLLPSVSFGSLDFNNPQDYARLHAVAGKDCVIVTAQALEQLPDCSRAIDLIAQIQRNSGCRIYHIEPVYEGASDVGRGYVERHDYCRNLLSSVLRHAPAARVRKVPYVNDSPICAVDW